MEIQGSLTTVALMALFAMFIVQAVKKVLREEYHKFIPLPLAAVCVAVGVGLAYLAAPGFEGMSLVAGGAAGFVSAAFAAFGYDFVAGILKAWQS